MIQTQKFSLVIWSFVHIAVSGLLALGASWLFGHLTVPIAGFSLLLGAIAGYYGAKALSSTSAEYRWAFWHSGVDGWLEKIFFALLALISLRHFYLVFYLEDGAWKALNPWNLGDLPLHISYIRAIALGNSFPLANPTYAQELLRYPYGMDMYNALWDCLGIPMNVHLMLVGLFCAYSSIIALKAFASWWGMIGFFLSGGLLGWIAPTPELLMKVQWKNLFLALLVPQRGFLFALPVGLYLLDQVSKKEKFQKASWRWLGLLWGALGFFHIHTFVVVSLAFAYFCLKNQSVKSGFKTFIAAAPLGIFFVLFSTRSFQQAGVMHLRWGWTFDGQESFIYFLIFNWGLYLILYVGILILLMKAWRGRHLVRETQDFIFYSLLFSIFMVVMLAPWEWDNVKVLLWPYLGFLGVAYSVLNGRLPVWSKPLMALALAVSGISALLPTLVNDEKAVILFYEKNLEEARAATEALPRDAVFLTSMHYAHDLNYWGRKRVMGYEGHLSSHGISYHREINLYRDIEIVDSVPGIKNAQALGAKYIYIGPEEARTMKWPALQWAYLLKNVSTVPDVTVFDVDTLPAP